MATRAIEQGRASALPTPTEAQAQLRAVLATLDYRTLAELAGLAIDRMDEIDGDPEDQQSDGDDFYHDASEDDFIERCGDHGPGCPISDPDAGNDDFGEPESDER